MDANSHNIYIFLAQEVLGLFPNWNIFQVFFIVCHLIGLCFLPNRALFLSAGLLRVIFASTHLDTCDHNDQKV